MKITENSDYMKYLDKTGYKFLGLSGKLTTKEAFDQTHRVYYISKIPVSGINPPSMLLFFRNNTFVKMDCEKMDELMSAMEVKFGKGVVESKIDTVNCTYKLTGNVVKETNNLLCWCKYLGTYVKDIEGISSNLVFAK